MVARIAVGAAMLVALGVSNASAAPTVSPSERAAITSLLDRYVPAALERRDPRLAYELSGPYVRGGMTLKEWLHGGIPVYPYPARGRDFGGWLLTWRTGDDIGLSLLIQPERGAKVGPVAFDVQLTRRAGTWLVNGFLPRATFAPTGKPAKVFSEQDLLPNGQSAASASGRLSPLWLAVPAAGVVGLLLLAAGGYAVHARRRDARAYREYLELDRGRQGL